jgi:hypothetical protein
MSLSVASVSDALPVPMGVGPSGETAPKRLATLGDSNVLLVLGSLWELCYAWSSFGLTCEAMETCFGTVLDGHLPS